MKKMYVTMLLMSIFMNLTHEEFCKKNNNLIMEWNLMKKEISFVKLSFMMNMKSTIFSSTVLLIFLSILIYSEFYMKNSKMIFFFFKAMLMFVVSMIVFINSSNMYSMITGWEGLGITSFILISFYNTNKTSSSAMQTMVINRTGDISMIMALIMMMDLNSTSISSISNCSKLIYWLIIMGAMTKSAQLPFSSWLTEAMMAPTPVSALVHSSTLVTAGVYLIMQIQQNLTMTMKITSLIVTTATLAMASMNSLTECDLKKIIALSTLSQMSMMMISIFLELAEMAFFHLILHASFKSLIFMCSSTFIMVFNTQDIRNMSIQKKLIFSNVSFTISNFSLMGLPFTAGFYSKDLIIEMLSLKNTSWLFLLTFMLSMTCSFIYSMKMMSMKNNKFYLMPQMETNNMKISKLMLVIPSLMNGHKMMWNLMMQSKFVLISLNEKTLLIKLMLFILLMINWKFKQKKSNKNLKTMNLMWFMKTMSKHNKMMILNHSITMYKAVEKGLIQTPLINMKKNFLSFQN
uniref:NADH:ubiquinone reductase (H(+)-translocating) n=1 Tax=Vasdavidius concursus TaxID=290153 RepID=Q5URQ1_9HEMI|nr:NADH dehydrogenase subunit 5 [Vasdavidius concursus]